MLLEPDGEELTFGEFARRCEVVAAGMAELGVGEGTVVSWQLPTRVDTVVLSMALARLGAIQNPILHLYREREVGFALRQTNSELFCVPGVWRGTDFTALAERALEGADRAPTLLVLDRGLPEGDPERLTPLPRHPTPRDPRCAGSTTRRAARPSQRACATPTRRFWRGAGVSPEPLR